MKVTKGNKYFLNKLNQQICFVILVSLPCIFKNYKCSENTGIPKMKVSASFWKKWYHP